MKKSLVLFGLILLPAAARAGTRWIVYTSTQVVNCSGKLNGGKLTMQGTDAFCADDADTTVYPATATAYYPFGLSNVSFVASQAAAPATAGALRLGSSEEIDWRSAGGGGNLALGKNGSDDLTYNGSTLLKTVSTGLTKTADTVLLTVPVTIANGGTGLSSYSQGDLMVSTATNMLSGLAKSAVATRYLANTGTNNQPEWGQVNLSNGVSSTLPITSGGTNWGATLANNRVMVSSGSALVEGAATTTSDYYVKGSIITIATGTTTTGASRTTNSYADTNLTATIVLKSASSRVLVQLNQTCDLSTSAITGSLKIVRASSDVYGPYPYFTSIAAYQALTVPIMFYDAPATTGSVTYKTQMALTTGSGTFACQDSFGGVNTQSQIILMEIAQ